MAVLLALAALTLSDARSPSAHPEPVALAFGEIFAPGPDLALSEKVRTLRGRRVRMEGYAAQMEDAPDGAFWLVPLPVKGDESGAGVGDLPPASVLVVVRSAREQPVRPAAKGLVSVTGVLEVGRGDAGAQGALLRIVLDRAPARPVAKPARARRRAGASPAPT